MNRLFTILGLCLATSIIFQDRNRKRHHGQLIRPFDPDMLEVIPIQSPYPPLRLAYSRKDD